MRSCFFVLRAVFCLLLMFSELSAAEANTVVVLRGSELSWEEASRVLEAELQASGFSVVRRSTNASTPGQLIDELRAAGGEDGGVRGAVAVFRGLPAPRAYVWLPERDDLVQLEAPFDAANVAPEVLALRIVELLRTRWALTPQDAAPAPAPAEPGAVRSVAWLALGPEFSFVSGQAPVQFAAGGNLRLFRGALLELSGSTSLMADEPSSRLGTIEVRKTRLALHPMFEFSSGDSLDGAVGPGAGALFLSARGLTQNPSASGVENNPVLFHSSLRGRVSLRSGPLAAMLMAEFSWLFTPLAFTAGDDRVLDYSGVALFVAGGLAWAH